MPLPSLPIEVIENVIDQAVDHTQTLRNLALTCCDLLPRTRYHLFTRIRLRDTTQLYSFYDFLDLYPRVASFVVSITLSTTPGDSKSLSLLQIIPTPLFRKLPNLYMWTITDPEAESRYPRQWLSFPSPTLTYLKTHGMAITKLYLSVSLRNCAQFAEYILAFRGLKELYCEYMYCKMDLGDLQLYRVRQRLAKQLQLSTLTIGYDVPNDAAAALLQSSPATLLHLELVVPESTRFDIPAIVSQLHALRSLFLVLQVGKWGGADIDSDPQAELVVRTFHIIKALSLYQESCLEKLVIRLHCTRILLFLDPLFNPDSYPALECCREFEAVLLSLRSLRNIEFHWYYDGQYDFDPIPLLEEYLPRLARERLVKFKHLGPTHLRQASHDSLIAAITVSPDSQRIATGSGDNTIILWDSQCRSIVDEWIAHSDTVNALAFSPDSRRLASGGGDKMAVVWDIIGPRVKRAAILKGHTHTVSTCAWSPDGTTLASGSVDSTVLVWDAETYQQLRSLQNPSIAPVEVVGFSPDGRWIASASRSLLGAPCAVWDAVTGDLHVVLSGHAGDPCIRNVVFDFATGRIATISRGGTIRIWDVEMGDEALVELEGHTGWVNDAAFSPDGRRVVSGSSDKTVKVWDSFSGDLLLSLEAHTDGVRVVCFSPDGKYIASASDDTTVRLWRASDGVCIETFTEHTDWVRHLLYSPDGETLTSGGIDGMVCIRRVCDVIGPEECSDYVDDLRLYYAPSLRTKVVDVMDMSCRSEIFQNLYA